MVSLSLIGAIICLLPKFKLEKVRALKTFLIALLFATFSLQATALANPAELFPSNFATYTFAVMSAYTEFLSFLALFKLLPLALLLILFPDRKRSGTINLPFPYAGFGLRLGAFILDYLLVFVPSFLLCLTVTLSTSLLTEKSIVEKIEFVQQVLIALAFPLYGAAFESSKLQATPGKLLFRIKVVDAQGQRCSFTRALARNLSFAVSDILLGFGYLMMLWTKDRQCLQDKIANCYLIRLGKERSKPL